MLQLGRGKGRPWPPALLNAALCGWLLLPLPLPADDVLASSASIRAKLSGPASADGPELPCPLLAAVLGLLVRWLLPAPLLLLLLLNLITKADNPAGAATRLLLLLNSAAGGPEPAGATVLPAVGPVLQRFCAAQPPLLLLAPSLFI